MAEISSFPFSAMGTVCNLHLYADTPAAAENASRAAVTEVRRIEQRYSRYRSESVLSEINRVAQQGGSIDLDQETAGLLDYAFACYQNSDGLFDISSGLLRRAWNFGRNQLPSQGEIDCLLNRIGLDKLSWRRPTLRFPVPGMELDLGGIGKEYAADRAAAVCVDLGIRHGLVELGGDIRVIGPHPDLAPWSIGIRHPRRPESLMATVEVEQGALATSGDYERCIEVHGKRYGHIINPKTGWPVEGLASVAVAADQCMVAGSLCTIAMLKGRGGVSWLEKLGVPHLWMDEAENQGRNFVTKCIPPSMPGLIGR